MSKNDESFDFEKGMQRLEEILNLFDEGGLSLDEMEKYFIEGMELSKKCSKRLEQVEVKVSTLLEEQEASEEEEEEDQDEERLEF